MRLTDAVAMLQPADLAGPVPQHWADLGCGHGTFTLALAELLPKGSTIDAADRDAAALARLRTAHHGVAIRPWHTDFLDVPWPFGGLDGAVLANALHYVADPLSLLRRASSHFKQPHRLLIVEYDTRVAGPWVPFPLDRQSLEQLATAAGYHEPELLATRRSIYNRAPLYAVSIRSNR